MTNDDKIKAARAALDALDGPARVEVLRHYAGSMKKATASLTCLDDIDEAGELYCASCDEETEHSWYAGALSCHDCGAERDQ